MTMNTTDLETRIIDFMEEEHNAKHQAEPAVVGVNVTQTPKEDGTLEATIEFEEGVPKFSREGVTPLARAIAKAVVEHISSHAQVYDDGGIGRIK